MDTTSDNHNIEPAKTGLLRSQLESKGLMLFVTLASIGDAVITTEEDGNVNFLNPVAEKLTGWPLADAIGNPIEEVFNLVDANNGCTPENPVRKALAIVEKVTIKGDVLLVRKDGTRVPIEDSAAPIQGRDGEVLGAILVFRDISERKNTEKLLMGQAQLDRTIAQISTNFATTETADIDRVIGETLQDVCNQLNASSAQIFVYNDSNSLLTCTHEWTNGVADSVKDKSIPLESLPYWAKKVKELHSFAVSSIDELPEDAVEEREFWVQRGLKSVALIPMAKGQSLLGFVSVDSMEQQNIWSDDQLQMLSITANLCSSAISRSQSEKALENSQNRLMEIGARIQQTLLCSDVPTDIPHFDIATLAIASKGIDGDFFDFLHHPGRCLDVVISDVMGKGLPAALLAAGTKAEFLRSVSHLLTRSPRGTIPSAQDIVADVHKVVTPQLIELESFATLSYVRFDFATRALHLVDCGSMPLLRCNPKSGEVEQYSGSNTPLGTMESDSFQVTELEYEPGDLFVLFSDGLTEARNPEGEFFRTERLKSIISKYCESSAEELITEIKKAAHAFRQQDVFADDLTCIVIKVGKLDYAVLERDVEEICISSRLNQLATVRTFFKEYCQHTPGMNLTENDEDSVELALNEATSNIIRHAYHGDENQRINIRISRTDNILILRLTHDGDMFEVRGEVPPPTFEGQKEGGMGLYIIESSLDSVTYGRDKTGVKFIEMKKALKCQNQEND